MPWYQQCYPFWLTTIKSHRIHYTVFLTGTSIEVGYDLSAVQFFPHLCATDVYPEFIYISDMSLLLLPEKNFDCHLKKDSLILLQWNNVLSCSHPMAATTTIALYFTPMSFGWLYVYTWWKVKPSGVLLSLIFCLFILLSVVIKYFSIFFNTFIFILFF